MKPDFENLPEWLQREAEAEIRAERRAMIQTLALIGGALLAIVLLTAGFAWFGGQFQ